MALLEIYLQDHLALATAGIRLARRCRGENREGELARFLDRLVPELEQDRAILVEVAEAVGVRRDRLKEAAALVGELLGRLKPNGRLLSYSDLSRVWELEALIAGTTSRLSAWDVLARNKAREPRLQGFAFEPLADRAKAQREELTRFHRAAAETAFQPRRVRLLAPAAPARGTSG